MISHVTILGAGWSGLATALKLQKAGLQTLVLEAQPQVGGLAKTLRWEGFHAEVGPKFFYTSEQSLAKEIAQLMGGTYQTRIRRNRVWFQGRWITYPLDARSLWQFPLSSLLRATAEYIRLRLEHQLPFGQADGHASGEKARRYGYLLDQLLMGEITRKSWQSSSGFLRPSWSSPAVEEQTQSPLEQLRESVRRLFGSQVECTATFHYPNEGMGSIANRMRARIEELGGQVKTNVKIRRVFAPGGEAQAVDYHHEGEHRAQTDYVFSTIPISSLLPLLDPLPPHALTELAFHLRYRALVMLQILHERENFDASVWHYFPEEQAPFFRVGYAVPSGRQAYSHRLACLNVEWMMEPDDPLLHASPDTLLEISQPLLQKAGLLDKGAVLKVGIHRERNAVPIYDQDYAQRLRQVSSYLTGIRRVRSIGRQGNFDSSSLQQALRGGFRAARTILDESASSRRPTTRQTQRPRN